MWSSSTVSYFKYTMYFEHIGNLYLFNLYSTDVCQSPAEPCQVSKMKQFVKIVKEFESLTIFTKGSILDV